MKPWEIYQWEFPHGEHPAVIVCPAARCDYNDIETVNVLGCSSRRAQRPALVNEVMLDEEDGLDWPTLCRCDVLFLARKDELSRRRGTVSAERRRELGQRIIRLFGLFRP